MALVLPLLILLLFGAIELGHFFMSEHVVQKSVRDAARYAARIPLVRADGTENFDCVTEAVGSNAELEIQRLARTGTPESGGSKRLQGWTSDDMTSVTVECDTSGTYTGVFSDFPEGVPVVTVSASVPYPTLFGTIVMGGATAEECDDQSDVSLVCLRLNAESQSAVFGA